MNYKYLTKAEQKREGNSKCIKDIILISSLGQKEQEELNYGTRSKLDLFLSAYLKLTQRNSPTKRKSQALIPIPIVICAGISKMLFHL